MNLALKKFEIFNGTGGVGKTTLATSRAINLAKKGNRVLLITIDPAKRLKELLNLKDDMAGEVVLVNDPLDDGSDLSLKVLLMNPSKTFQKIAHISNASEITENRILKILTKPNGGLNEILSVVELQLQYETKEFDTIILDTPPGSHFLDFLDSMSRIKLFFDQSFIDIFQYLGKKDVNAPKKSKLMNKLVSTGIKKILGYLKSVTGESFIDEFIDAITAFYKTKSSFISALEIQEKIKDQSKSNWFLVTSVEQDKLDQAIELKEHSQNIISNKSFVIINKCLPRDIWEWSTSNDAEASLKKSLIQNETRLKDKLSIHFENVLEFSEIINVNPLEHIRELTTQWDN